MSDKVDVFVSYSHKDREYLAEDSLLGFLKGLEKDGVEFWTDRQIRTGELWDEVIKAKIQDAPIALVLVSQGFLDSDYCQKVEIRNFLANNTTLSKGRIEGKLRECQNNFTSISASRKPLERRCRRSRTF